MSEEKVNEAERYFSGARTLANDLTRAYAGQNKEVVARVLTAGIARHQALETLKGLNETTDAELVKVPKQVIESAGMQLKNYDTDIYRKAAEIGRKYDLTAENLTAKGHGVYVAKKQGRTCWQDTRRSRKVAEPESVDAVLA